MRSGPGLAPRSSYARTRFLQCRVPEEASRGDGHDGLGRRVPLDRRASVSRNIRGGKGCWRGRVERGKSARRKRGSR